MSAEVEPRSTVSSSWYFSWKKRNGIASASTTAPVASRSTRSRRVRIRTRTLDSASDGPPRLLASIRDGCVGLRRGRPRDPGHGCRSARARPGGVRHLCHRPRGRRLLPGPPRPDGGGAADEVRIPLRRRRGVGEAAPSLRPCPPDQVRRRSPRRIGAGAPCSGGGHDLRGRGACRTDSRGRTHAARASDGERGRDRALASRALRPEGRVPDVRHGVAARRDCDRGSLRRHGDVGGHGRRAGDRHRGRIDRRPGGLSPISLGSLAPARGGPSRGDLLHARLERRDRGRLAADDSRSTHPRNRRRPDADRPLPHRPDAADRALGGQLTRAARPAHRPDAGLGARQAWRACSPACAHTRSSRSD